MAKQHLVVCISNEGYPASLETRKLYVAIPDAESREARHDPCHRRVGRRLPVPKEPVSLGRRAEALPQESGACIRRSVDASARRGCPLLGDSPEFWLNVQWRTGLWEAMSSPEERQRIERAWRVTALRA
jgi:hypothetical protein